MISIRRFAPWQMLFAAVVIALAVALTWSLLVSHNVAAAPRPVTPRGELTIEERSNIDVFEAWKASVVFIDIWREGKRVQLRARPRTEAR